MEIICAGSLTVLELGKRGSNQTRAIRFDIAEWMADYPDGSVHILHKRPGEETPLPVSNTEKTDTYIDWVIEQADVANEGYGECELVMMDTISHTAKSVTYMTHIGTPISSSDETVPEPHQGWVDSVLQAATDAEAAKNAAVDAQTAAETAQSAAEAAQTAAEKAQDTAENAKASAVMSSNAAYNYAADANRAKRDSVNAKNDAVQAKTDAENAQEAAENAEESANTSALKSEGYAVGTQNGTPAGSGEPYYQDNAKYYKEQAAAAKTAAETARDTAQQTVAGIEAAGTAQVGRVAAEGATQVTNVQTKGQQVLDSIPSDYSQLSGNVDELKSAFVRNNDLVDAVDGYELNGSININWLQGARGQDAIIVSNAKYVSAEKLLKFPVGAVLALRVNTSGVQANITEWDYSTGDLVYIGLVDSWKTSVTYSFVANRVIAITLKRSNNTNLTPEECDVDISMVSDLWEGINNNTKKINSILDHNTKEYNSFIQGYYLSDGSLNPNARFVTSPIEIVAGESKYIVPASNSYDVAIYMWDYANGVYSNFTSIGWISSEQNISLTDGKAIAITLRVKNSSSTTLDPATVTYSFYKASPFTRLFNYVDGRTPKKVACVGDSLTQGVDVGQHVIAENYPHFMALSLGCDVLNYGVAGADTMEYWQDNLSTFTFDNTIDAVLIMLGTNGGGIPNTLETDVYPYTNYNDYADTYCGDYCKIIRKIIELTGNHAQVYLLTPPYTTYSTAQLNRVKTARETIKEIGLYFNLPVIDVFAECGMGAYNADVFRPHDGCHFNAKGYHRLGTFIASKVISAHSEWSVDDVYPDETPVT